MEKIEKRSWGWRVKETWTAGPGVQVVEKSSRGLRSLARVCLTRVSKILWYWLELIPSKRIMLKKSRKTSLVKSSIHWIPMHVSTYSENFVNTYGIYIRVPAAAPTLASNWICRLVSALSQGCFILERSNLLLRSISSTKTPKLSMNHTSSSKQNDWTRRRPRKSRWEANHAIIWLFTITYESFIIIAVVFVSLLVLLITLPAPQKKWQDLIDWCVSRVLLVDWMRQRDYASFSEGRWSQ